jgi:hypothetical protein
MLITLVDINNSEPCRIGINFLLTNPLGVAQLVFPSFLGAYRISSEEDCKRQNLMEKDRYYTTG